MRKSLIYFLFLLPFGAFAALPAGPFIGTYTIGGAEASFPTFQSAIDAIEKYGVNGPVTFKVNPGTYTEQLTLTQIPGSSAAMPVHFTAANNDAASVKLNHFAENCSSNYVIGLMGTDNIVFENITCNALGTACNTALKLSGQLSNVQFSNVVFNSGLTTSGLNSSVVYATLQEGCYNLQIDNCEINNGSYGIYFNGFESDPSEKLTITNNLFDHQTDAAVVVSNAIAPKVNSNVIVAAESCTNFTGVSLQNCGGSLSVSSNIIDVKSGHQAVNIVSCTGSDEAYGIISNNVVSMLLTQKAIAFKLDENSGKQFMSFNRVKTSDDLSGNQLMNSDASANSLVVNNIYFSQQGKYYAVYNNTTKEYSGNNQGLMASYNSAKTSLTFTRVDDADEKAAGF